MGIQPIAKGQIVSVLETYNALCSRLKKDRLDYENYQVLEPDEERAKIALNKVRHDFEEIGQFLDEVI